MIVIGPVVSMQREFLEQVTRWAEKDPNVLALGLVGSYARGTAAPSSDIDLVIITSDPELYLYRVDWLSLFGTAERQQVEDYGKLVSLRAWYRDGKEMEFGFTTPAWCAEPLDEGTRQVVSGGLLVLYEREPLLSPLLAG